MLVALFGGIAPEGFLDDEVFPRCQHGGSLAAVQMVRAGDMDHVDCVVSEGGVKIGIHLRYHTYHVAYNIIFNSGKITFHEIRFDNCILICQ